MSESASLAAMSVIFLAIAVAGLIVVLNGEE